MNELPNIYKVLEEIDFDGTIDKIKRNYHIDESANLKQPIFSIIQEFYEKIIDCIM